MDLLANYRRRPLAGLTSLAAAYYLVFVSVLAFRPFDDASTIAFDDLAGLVAPFGAAAILLVASHNAAANIKRAWLYLGCGVLAWGIGDLIWAFYEVALAQEAPFPSVGDAFYLAGYPLLFLGALSFSNRNRVSSGLRTTLDAVTLTLAGSAVIWRVAVDPVIQDSTLGRLEMLLSALYPMGDVLVLFAVALAIFRNRDGQAGTVFSIFATGMLVTLASDVGFAYMENAGTYESGSLLDAGWILGFLLMGYGGALQLAWRPRYSNESDEVSVSAWKQGLPLIIMLALASWVILDGFDGTPAGLPVLVMTMLTVIAVVVRQFLTLRENIQLRLVLEDAYRAERERARRDPLTGKLNRRATEELVDTLVSSSPDRGFVLGMVDIDGMKRINDSHGHHCGDEALVAVAAALGRGATVGRYGGDEFLVILEGATLATVEDYRSLVRSLLDIWSASRGDGLQLRISMGFAFAPADGRGAADLIKVADRRMYDVKRLGAAA